MWVIINSFGVGRGEVLKKKNTIFCILKIKKTNFSKYTHKLSSYKQLSKVKLVKWYW